MTAIEGDRIVIRAFVPNDLAAIHRILGETFGDGSRIGDPAALEERRSWLQWSILSHEWLAKIHQPPYGDQAIVLRDSGELIGSAGYVPCLAPFGQIPELATAREPEALCSPEVGLFWAVAPQHQKQGYATEAARAMIDHAFGELRLKRIIATTEYTNVASQAVMRKVGMRLCRNPIPEPRWMQIVGVAENTRTRA